MISYVVITNRTGPTTLRQILLRPILFRLMICRADRRVAHVAILSIERVRTRPVVLEGLIRPGRL